MYSNRICILFKIYNNSCDEHNGSRNTSAFKVRKVKTLITPTLSLKRNKRENVQCIFLSHCIQQCLQLFPESVTNKASPEDTQRACFVTFLSKKVICSFQKGNRQKVWNVFRSIGVVILFIVQPIQFRKAKQYR